MAVVGRLARRGGGRVARARHASTSTRGLRRPASRRRCPCRATGLDGGGRGTAWLALDRRSASGRRHRSAADADRPRHRRRLHNSPAGGQATFVTRVGGRLIASVAARRRRPVPASAPARLDWLTGRVLLRRGFGGPVDSRREHRQDLWALQVRPAALLHLDPATLAPTASPCRSLAGERWTSPPVRAALWVTAVDDGDGDPDRSGLRRDCNAWTSAGLPPASRSPATASGSPTRARPDRAPDAATLRRSARGSRSAVGRRGCRDAPVRVRGGRGGRHRQPRRRLAPGGWRAADPRRAGRPGGDERHRIRRGRSRGSRASPPTR